MNRHELHPCPRCGRPMVASYAMGCFGGSAGVDVPLGYDCVNIQCKAERQQEWEDREDAAIRRAIERGVINE